MNGQRDRQTDRQADRQTDREWQGSVRDHYLKLLIER